MLSNFVSFQSIHMDATLYTESDVHVSSLFFLQNCYFSSFQVSKKHIFKTEMCVAFKPNFDVCLEYMLCPYIYEFYKC